MARMALFAPRRFFLAQTGELNIFNKQQANHRNTQHPYRQPEQRMVAPDFNHNSVNRAAIIQPTREVFAYNVVAEPIFQASSPENKACRYHREYQGRWH